jgi:CheY-like chemotaxis protein
MNTEVNAILEIDDESAVRTVVESILVSAGYVLLSAEDGVEGLRVSSKPEDYWAPVI